MPRFAFVLALAATMAGCTAGVSTVTGTTKEGRCAVYQELVKQYCPPVTGYGAASPVPGGGF